MPSIQTEDAPTRSSDIQTRTGAQLCGRFSPWERSSRSASPGVRARRTHSPDRMTQSRLSRVPATQVIVGRTVVAAGSTTTIRTIHLRQLPNHQKTTGRGSCVPRPGSPLYSVSGAAFGQPDGLGLAGPWEAIDPVRAAGLGTAAVAADWKAEADPNRPTQ
jgi:hypothetical protein